MAETGRLTGAMHTDPSVAVEQYLVRIAYDWDLPDDPEDDAEDDHF